MLQEVYPSEPNLHIVIRHEMSLHLHVNTTFPSFVKKANLHVQLANKETQYSKLKSIVSQQINNLNTAMSLKLFT